MLQKVNLFGLVLNRYQVLSKIPQQLHQVTIGSTTVHCCDVVRYLGVYLDSELTMKKHTSKTVSTCYYHL